MKEGGEATFKQFILYYFKKGKSTTKMQKKKKNYVVFGEGAMTDPMCQKWFVKFHAGDFSLKDAPVR